MTRNKGLKLMMFALPMLGWSGCLQALLGGSVAGLMIPGCTATGGRTITLGFEQKLTVTDKADQEAVGDTYSSGFSEGFLEMIVGWFDKPEAEGDATDAE